jgi:hypothetical protein
MQSSRAHDQSFASGELACESASHRHRDKFDIGRKASAHFKLNARLGRYQAETGNRRRSAVRCCKD